MACHYDCFFINGVWVKPHSDDVISLENPATGEVFAHVPDGTPEDVANAIERPHKHNRHGPPRRFASVSNACKRLLKFSELIEKRSFVWKLWNWVRL